jgi:hypothetical protein
MKLKFPPRMERAVLEPSFYAEHPLLVRLTENVGKLPAGFVYELPPRLAQTLIASRKAQAVGNFGIMADLSLTEDECVEAGIA